MGFQATIEADEVRLALACDAPGCRGTIGRAWDARVVVGPDRPAALVRFACGDACAEALTTPGVLALDLTMWWEAMAERLGLDDEDDEPAIDADDFLAALAELEDVAQRPGVPAGLTVRDAAGLGYLSRSHVTDALRTVGLGS